VKIRLSRAEPGCYLQPGSVFLLSLLLKATYISDALDS